MIKELGSATNHDVFTLSTVSKHLKHNGIDVADLCLFKESGAKCLNGICKILSLRCIDINCRIGVFSVSHEGRSCFRLCAYTLCNDFLTKGKHYAQWNHPIVYEGKKHVIEVNQPV